MHVRPYAVAAIAALAAVSSSASASAHHPHHPHHPRCAPNRVLKRVKVREHRHGHVVTVREWRCVKRAPHHAASPQPIPLAPPSTPATPLPAATPSVRASIDPSYTQDPSDPLKVTWQYDAGVADGTLPPGTLNLTVSEPNAAGATGGCTINVGGTITGGTCPVELPHYGAWNVTVSYVGASSTVAPATSTDTEYIEPPPATIEDQWGSTPPSAQPTVSANVVGSNAHVTVSDQNYEGATSVGVTDDLGDTCTATVQGTDGTQAVCDMAVSGTPRSYTIAYPGGTSQTSSRPVAPGGTQTVTYDWPADSITVSNPSVTVQRATLTWCGGYGGTWGDNGCGAPPNPLSVSTETRVELGATTVGSLHGEIPQGYLTFTVTGPGGATYTTYDQEYNPSYSPDASQDCSMVGTSQTAGGPIHATGDCLFTFGTPGQYTVGVSFTSTDGQYGTVAGPSEMVNVN